jgi:hypothetical protein
MRRNNATANDCSQRFAQRETGPRAARNEHRFPIRGNGGRARAEAGPAFRVHDEELKLLSSQIERGRGGLGGHCWRIIASVVQRTRGREQRSRRREVTIRAAKPTAQSASADGSGTGCTTLKVTVVEDTSLPGSALCRRSSVRLIGTGW